MLKTACALILLETSALYKLFICLLTYYRASWETSLDWSCFAEPEWQINRKKNDWKTYERQQNVANVRRSL